MSASCKALCHLSYVWPGAVLPLVLGRFPTAITSLALCVRPLLLAGWHTEEESTQQVGACSIFCSCFRTWMQCAVCLIWA